MVPVWKFPSWRFGCCLTGLKYLVWYEFLSTHIIDSVMSFIKFSIKTYISYFPLNNVYLVHISWYIMYSVHDHSFLHVTFSWYNKRKIYILPIYIPFCHLQLFYVELFVLSEVILCKDNTWIVHYGLSSLLGLFCCYGGA